MKRWYKQSFPPRIFTYVFFGAILLADLMAIGVSGFWSRLIGFDDGIQVAVPLLILGSGLGTVAAGILAVCRIERFPAYRKDYYEWLATTPWQASEKTPFGPWYPMLRDIIPLSLFSVVGAVHSTLMIWAMSWRFNDPAPFTDRISDMAMLTAAAPFVVFILVWALGGYLAVFRQWDWSVFVPLLTIGLLIHLAFNASTVVSVSAAVAVFVLATVTIWRQMKIVLDDIPSRHLTSRDEPPAARLSTSSFTILSPSDHPSLIMKWLQKYRTRAFAFATLLTVWLSLFPWFRHELWAVPLSAVILCLVRLVAFMEYRDSHLTLAARWATGRWFVPEFERVYVPSLLMLLSSFGFAYLGFQGFIPVVAGAVGGIVVPVLIGMLSGPDHEKWALTAPLRHTKRTEPQRRKQPQSIFG